MAFQKGHTTNQGISRRKSILRAYVHDSDIIKSDVKKIATFMLEQSVEDLMRLIKNPETPIFVTGFASALLKDLKAGSITAINTLLEWGFGKPDQTIVTDGSITQRVIDLSYGEREEMRINILKKMGWKPPKEEKTTDIVKTENVIAPDDSNKPPSKSRAKRAQKDDKPETPPES